MVLTLRLAVATEDFGVPLRMAIHQAADCGAQGVRLNARSEIRADQFSATAMRQLKLLISERQMKVAGLLFPSRRPLYDQKNLDRRLDGIRSAMLQVQQLGTNELLVRCGKIPDPESESSKGVDSAAVSNSEVNSLANPFSFAPSAGLTGQTALNSAQQFAMLVEILNDLTRYGNHIGCTLQLQVASFEVDSIVALMNTVTGGPLQIVFDPATVIMTGGSAISVFRDLYQYVGYVRARDAIRDVDGAGVEVALGEGVVDWTELIPTFSEADFTGWVCVERSGGDQRADDVRNGVARICNLVSGF